MEILKKAVTEARTLIRLDLSPSAGTIVMNVDASTIGWGAEIHQFQ
jgi:hypothetical protein